jgi:hypothetical protein
MIEWLGLGNEWDGKKRMEGRSGMPYWCCLGEA